MANNCYGRRLSDLLQEQQEPFLLHGGVAEAQRRRRRLRLHGQCNCGNVSDGAKNRRSIANGGVSALGRSVLCGGKAVRRALRWDIAGCFSCGAGESFRRLRRAGDTGDRDVSAELDGGRGRGGEDGQDREGQLSPVSVLELHCDEEPPTPPSGQDFLGAASPCFAVFSSGGSKICAMEVEEEKEQVKKASGEQAIVSAWERIAAEISRIPRLVELDLAGSVREWRRRIDEEEARLVAENVEAMIFEETRWEAVRDMLCPREF
uniref:DUF4378 domain-containing protein n=1 Tax=Arundo donax TaxID=35708 RepID=A0A0A9AEA3_ARUDO